METFCLVLTGEIAGDEARAAVLTALAGAFDMDPAAFHEKVWQRAPLIIRQSLDAASARAQATQLESLGAKANALPDDGSRIWLLRERQILGPLPESALSALAHAGDQWCHDGESQWHHWHERDPLSPPPLPSAPGVPPPLPENQGQAPRGRRTAPWLVGGAAVLALLALAWHNHAPSPKPKPAPPVHYVPRPLQPLTDEAPKATTTCNEAGTPADVDEDRFLVAGGQRQLTGRSRRDGDTYVTEAVLQRDSDCRASEVQLYLFRHGVFVGTAMDAPIDPRQTRLVDFQLPDDHTLTYVLSRCDTGGGNCQPGENFTTTLRPDAGGWVPVRGNTRPEADAPEIIRHPAPHYPPDAVRQRHQGTVMLLLTVGPDGLPQQVKVEQSSGYAELDQAAIESARQWRFKTASASGKTTTHARIPVRFHLDPLAS